MATFLVERFWPGLTAAGAELATAALVGAGAAVVETIVASSDEVCLWYVEAVSTAEVMAAFAAAAVPVDRIGPATRLRPGDAPTAAGRESVLSPPHDR